MKVYVFYSEKLKMCWACLAESLEQAEAEKLKFAGPTNDFGNPIELSRIGQGILYYPAEQDMGFYITQPFKLGLKELKTQ